MTDLDFEWVVKPCGRDNLEDTLNQFQSNEIEIYSIHEHVVESTSYRSETILFTVVGVRRVQKRKQKEDLIECLEYAVDQTRGQLKDDTVLSSEGRDWLDKSKAVITSVREDLVP